MSYGQLPLSFESNGLRYFRIWHTSAIATFGGPLVSGGRYFRMAKTCTPKNVKGILFEKR